MKKRGRGVGFWGCFRGEGGDGMGKKGVDEDNVNGRGGESKGGRGGEERRE